MSINILSNQKADLSTVLSGGIQPYDPCTRWEGGYTASNGTTGLIAATGTTAAAGTPYIESSNSPCAIPGTNKASLTGIFRPNGFTGTANVWVYVKDASGVEGESNHISYNVLPSASLVVYAGPDQTVTTGGPVILPLSGATASNGTPPYTWEWTASLLNPEPTYFTPDEFQQTPDVEEFLTNGVYTYNLLVTDAIGQTGTDSVTVTVSGNISPIGPEAVEWNYTVIGDFLGSLTIERRRSGITSTILTQSVSAIGTIPIGSGPGAFQDGDEIRVSISSVYGGVDPGTWASTVDGLLTFTNRIPPYLLGFEWADSDFDNGGISSISSGWIPITPSTKWYQVTATASGYSI